MKNRDLYGMRQLLNSMKDKKGTKFAYAITKNLGKIGKKLEKLDELQLPSDEIQKYQKEVETKRMKLLEELVEKDKEGKPIFIKMVQKIGEDKKPLLLEDGKPDMERIVADRMDKDASFDLTDESLEKFNEIIKKVNEKKKEEFKDAFDKQTENQNNFMSLLEEDCEIELHKVKVENLPDDLNANQIEALDLLIME